MFIIFSERFPGFLNLSGSFAFTFLLSRIDKFFFEFVLFASSVDYRVIKLRCNGTADAKILADRCKQFLVDWLSSAVSLYHALINVRRNLGSVAAFCFKSCALL